MGSAEDSGLILLMKDVDTDRQILDRRRQNAIEEGLRRHCRGYPRTRDGKRGSSSIDSTGAGEQVAVKAMPVRRQRLKIWIETGSSTTLALEVSRSEVVSSVLNT